MINATASYLCRRAPTPRNVATSPPPPLLASHSRQPLTQGHTHREPSVRCATRSAWALRRATEDETEPREGAAARYQKHNIEAREWQGSRGGGGRGRKVRDAVAVRTVRRARRGLGSHCGRSRHQREGCDNRGNTLHRLAFLVDKPRGTRNITELHVPLFDLTRNIRTDQHYSFDWTSAIRRPTSAVRVVARARAEPSAATAARVSSRARAPVW